VVCLCTCIHTYPDSEEMNRRGQQKWFVYGHVYTRIQKCMWMCMFVPGVAVYSEERERRKPEGVCMYAHIYNNACGHVYTYLVWQYDRRKGNVGLRKRWVCICIHAYTKIHVDVYVGTWCGSIFGGKGTSETARGVCACVYTRMQIFMWMCIHVPGVMVDSEERER